MDKTLCPSCHSSITMFRKADQNVCCDRVTGRVVFIITTHSVHRPGGCCLNEIAMALIKKVDTVAVMLVFSERRFP
jgi:hypothetical protein